MSSTTLRCSGLKAGSFSGGSTSVTLAGDTASLSESFDIFGTPTHTVTRGNLGLTQARSVLVLSAENVGTTSTDVTSIKVGSQGTGTWFPCTGVTMTDHATDTAKKVLQCTLNGGVGAGLTVNVTTKGGRSSASNQQYSFARPTILSMTPEVAALTVGNYVIEGENLGNTALGLVPTNVRLGGRPCARVELISSSQLNCSGLDGTGGYSTTTVDLSVGNQVVSAPIFQFDGAPLISSVVPAVGRAEGGQTITLKGENLGERAGDIDAITIGGRACTSVVLVTTDAVVTCVTPPGVGSFVELQYRKATGVRTGGTGLF